MNPSEPETHMDPIALNLDGRCNCNCADVCPLYKIGMSERCTTEELHAHGFNTCIALSA